jgi:pimeloyl-ACP methyl ester carboxylesterase
MGGFIAQEFALKYPDRLDRLVLVATGFGGPNMVPVPAEAQAALMPSPELSPEKKIRAAMPVAFGDRSWPEKHRDEFERIVSWRLEYPQPPEAALAQVIAGLTFNVEQRLGQIAAPTLVVAGTDDAVVPVRNAELLAAALPRARLDLIPGAGHLVFIEEAERFNQDVMHFLQAEELA